MALFETLFQICRVFVRLFLILTHHKAIGHDIVFSILKIPEKILVIADLCSGIVCVTHVEQLESNEIERNIKALFSFVKSMVVCRQL